MAKWVVLSVEKYGLSQRRQMLVLVACRGEEPLAHVPLAQTHAIPSSAGEAQRGCEGIEGRAITGVMLEKVRIRVGMTREQVGGWGTGRGMLIASWT